MLNDWICSSTVAFLERHELIILAKDGRSVKGYYRKASASFTTDGANLLKRGENNAKMDNR